MATYIVSVLYIQSNQRSTGSKDACHATGVTDGKMVYTPCKNRRFFWGGGVGGYLLGDFVPFPPANKMPKIRPFPGMTEGP